MTEALTVDVVDSAGKKTGSVELPAEVFDAPLNIPLMHQVVVGQLAAARQGTHATKTRGDVRGGGRKPYRQKGTGRARQGSTRAPQFVGGGTVHGPQPPRLHPADPQEDEGRRPAQRPVRPRPQRPRPRHHRVRHHHGALHQERPGRAAQPHRPQGPGDRGPSGRPVQAQPAQRPEAHVLWADQLNTYDVLKSDDVVFTASGLDAFLGKGEEESK